MGYGAAAKATIICNLLKIKNTHINFIFDQNKFKQSRFIPGTNIEIKDITKFESYLLKKVRSNGKNILEEIQKKQSIDDELEKKLNAFLETTSRNFLEENNAKS